MSVGVKIKDVRESALDFESPRGTRLPVLREFFQLFRYTRKFTNPSVLASCSFYDLYIDYRFGSLPGRPGPPHPGSFADFSPTILSGLVGPGNSLTLFVNSVVSSYLVEGDVIKPLIALRNLRYVLLASAAVGTS